MLKLFSDQGSNYQAILSQIRTRGSDLGVPNGVHLFYIAGSDASLRRRLSDIVGKYLRGDKKALDPQLSTLVDR